jgi:hypothetical protein
MKKFIFLVLVFIFLFPFLTSVETFTGDRSGGFSSGGSYQFTTPAYDQPGFLGSGYGFGVYDDLSPQEYQEVCRDRKDFIVQIAPGGCSPAVVRSDLLAEQNVPVFCKLQAIQINPTITPEQIRSMAITQIGERAEGVANVGYFRPKSQISTSQTNQGFLALDNVGYVVIVLQRQADERNLPNNVTGTLSARFSYNIPNSFGLGLSERAIPVLSDEEWGKRYKEFSVMDGKAYLRVTGVSENELRVVMYSDVSRVIDSFNIPKGGSSSERYLPGGYCGAKYSITYVDSVVPKNKAVLLINGERFEVYEGEQFANGLCRMGPIEMGEFGGGSAIVACNGEQMVLKLNARDIELSIDEVSEEKNVGDKLYDNVYLGGIGSSKQGLGNFVLLVSLKDLSSENKLKINQLIDKLEKSNNPFNEKLEGIETEIVFQGENEDFEGKKIGFIGFAQGVDQSSGNENFESYFNRAVGTFKEIERVYDGTYVDISNEEVQIGKEALEEGLDLVKGKDKTQTEKELRNLLSEAYGVEVEEEDFIYDDLDASSVLKIDGVENVVRLIDIDIPGFEDYGIVLEVDGVSREFSKNDEVISSEGGVEIVLKSFDENGAKIVGNCGNKEGKGENLVELGSRKLICGSYVSVKKINIEKNAKIAFKTASDNMGGEVNFSYGIGIEKRAIELNPEKTKQKIARLDENIKKWEDINENLGSLVSGMKGACLATSAALQVKNLVTGLGGKAMARQEVMRGEGGWNAYCEDAVSKGSYNSLDHCFSEHANQIDRDVSIYAKELEDINSEIKRIESRGDVVIGSGGLFGDKSVDYDKSKELYYQQVKSELGLELEDAEILSYEELKELVLYKRLGEQGSDNLQSVSQNNYDDLNSNVEDLIRIQERAEELERESSNLGLSGPPAYYHPLEEVDKVRPYEDWIVNSDSSDFSGVAKGTRMAVVSLDGKDYFVSLQSVNDQDTQFRISSESVIFDESKNVVDGDSDVLRTKLASEYPLFQKFSSESYSNGYQNPEVRYYETGESKGVPAVVPIDIQEGWYAGTKQSFGNSGSFEESGSVRSFWLCNVGPNGKEEFNKGLGDDICSLFNSYTGQPIDQFAGLSESKTRKLVSDARQALEQAASQYGAGVTNVEILGKNIKVGNPQANVPGTQCQDFMSPSDCKLMFQVCDPVICPSSRCNLGGKYYVDNVVQTGIVGSVALCLPNVKEGIVVPVCLTGVHAGVENWVSVMKAYQGCLNESLETGQYTGICDQISAIYKCEFFWNQVSPLMNNILPKLLQSFTGSGARGGGEYMFVQEAWSNMQSSVDYFKSYYAEDAVRAFQIRSTQEVGTQVCKSFISMSFPNKFKTFIEPDSPTQYTAWFDEISGTSATTPARSHYKVFYHIYAGEDQGAYYSIYLKDAPGSSFVQSSGSQMVATGFVNKGEYVSESRDFESVSGFQQLCVRVNTQEECGFKRVSTSFALDYLQDMYVKEQVENTNINSEDECISGSVNAMSVVAGGINAQSLASEGINPADYKRGIIRVCATDNPGSGTDVNRWKEVGNCGSSKVKCWLDTSTIKDIYTDGNVGFENETENYFDNLENTLEGLREGEEVDFEGSNTKNKLRIISDKINSLNGDFEDAKVEADIALADLAVVRERTIFGDLKAWADFIEGGIYKSLAEISWKSVVEERADARKNAQGTKSCYDLGGEWKEECGDGENDKSSRVTDQEELNANNGKKCCVEVGGEGEGGRDIRDISIQSYSTETDLRIFRILSEENLSSFFVSKNHGELEEFSSVLINSAKQNNLDPYYVVAHFIHETGWGSSRIWNDKNNPFGIGAFDDSPFQNAYQYESKQKGIEEGVQWIKNNYLSDNAKYSSNNLKEMNENYATDSEWANKIVNLMNDLNDFSNSQSSSSVSSEEVISEFDIGDLMTSCIDAVQYSPEVGLSPPNAFEDIINGLNVDNCPEEQRPFLADILEMSKELDVDFNLVRAIVDVESTWNPRAKSGGNALGLMQITPITFAEVNQRAEIYCGGDISEYVEGTEDLTKYTTSSVPSNVLSNLIGSAGSDNVKINLFYGTCYLKILEQHEGYGSPPDLEYLLTAYNKGPIGLKRVCAPYEKGQFEEKCLPKLTLNEQKEYADKVLKRYEKFKNE